MGILAIKEISLTMDVRPFRLDKSSKNNIFLKENKIII
jgi:hypothetical protein